MMTVLDKEIAALETEIAEYEVDLKNATTREEKSELRGLIKASLDTLNELMKLQREATKGNYLLLFCFLLAGLTCCVG
jgi:hypothetical protein